MITIIIIISIITFFVSIYNSFIVLSFNNLFVFGRLNFTDNYYYVEIEPFLIERLKEIYETGDIALLTFYEFLWLEEHYNLFFGFLSSIGDKRYNFTMRDCINKIKNAENKSIKNYSNMKKKP